MFKLDFKPRVFLFLAFFVPIVVRIIPEILMGSYVVGFDTLAYYVPNTLVWLQNVRKLFVTRDCIYLPNGMPKRR